MLASSCATSFQHASHQQILLSRTPDRGYTFSPGQRFGELTIVRFVRKSEHGNVWELECDCGNRAYRAASSLMSALRHNKKPCCRICRIELFGGLLEHSRLLRIEQMRDHWEEYGSLWSPGKIQSLTARIRDDLAELFGFYPEDDQENDRFKRSCRVSPPRQERTDDCWHQRMPPGRYTGNFPWLYVGTVIHEDTVTEAKQRHGKFLEEMARKGHPKHDKRDWLSWLSEDEKAHRAEHEQQEAEREQQEAERTRQCKEQKRENRARVNAARRDYRERARQEEHKRLAHERATKIQQSLDQSRDRERELLRQLRQLGAEVERPDFAFRDDMDEITTDQLWQKVSRYIVTEAVKWMCGLHSPIDVCERGAPLVSQGIMRRPDGKLNLYNAASDLSSFIRSKAAVYELVPEIVIQQMIHHCLYVAQVGWDNYVSRSVEVRKKKDAEVAMIMDRPRKE